MPSSSGSQLNRSIDEGGSGWWEEQGGRVKECSCRCKPLNCHPKTTTRNTSTQKLNITMEDTIRLWQEEGGAFSGLPPAALQPQMQIGAHESEDIHQNFVTCHSWCLQNQERHLIEEGGIISTGVVSIICEGNNKVEWTGENIFCVTQKESNPPAACGGVTEWSRAQQRVSYLGKGYIRGVWCGGWDVAGIVRLGVIALSWYLCKFPFVLLSCLQKWKIKGLIRDEIESQGGVVERRFPCLSARGYIIISNVNIYY